ncbi:MAG: 7-carboxy-7-deazaguanine synthase QueE [Verrucomicrobiales bacterium]|nr:7-carboxy-7-deazaguanine synthase QueE [Verrucomicrobiales bacterium]
MKLARMPDGRPEIFYTLQGEGRNTGKPSVFIRSSLCNLHCVWCDTPYTWNWEDTTYQHESDAKYRREEQIIDFSIEEICEAVTAYPCQNYVLTGGEPLLQENAWLTLMGVLSGSFEIETNGTLLPGAEFLEKISQINVSPKLANSGVTLEDRWKPDVLSSLASTGKADFKFVIATPEDFTEVTSLVRDSGIPGDHVFLMAKAGTAEELEKNQGFVADLAMDEGFHYSDRLHLRLFGSGRGV